MKYIIHNLRARVGIELHSPEPAGAAEDVCRLVGKYGTEGLIIIEVPDDTPVKVYNIEFSAKQLSAAAAWKEVLDSEQ